MDASKEIALLREELAELRREMAISRRERINARAPDKEVPDPKPIAIPIAMQTPPTMAELVQKYVAGALSEQAASQQMGTFEEEDDFEEEDPELLALSLFELNAQQMEDEVLPEPSRKRLQSRPLRLLLKRRR